jgi:perosamine synthetase
MKLNTRFSLIPRNNWDYDLEALFYSFEHLRINGTYASSIENMFSQKPIWTNTGRTSLYAILKSMDLPAGSKVGVPLFCCSVVFNAICQAGLVPHFIDSNLNDCNILVDDLLKKRSELAAVVTVHMFGNPCDMDEIIATANGLPVIEDCAQSIFSTYKGKPTGSLSTASFFSFRCGKYISSGEGSAIFCAEPELQKKIELLVDTFENESAIKLILDSWLTFAKAALYNRPLYGLIGYPIGMRLDKKLNLTAKNGFVTGKIAPTSLSIIDARLAKFNEKITVQRENARLLLSLIKASNIILPSEHPGTVTNWFQFALRFQNTKQRNTMADYLLNHGIDTSKYLDDIADEALSTFEYKGDCPNAEFLSKTILLVPIHYKLHVSDIEHIAQTINDGSHLI